MYFTVSNASRLKETPRSSPWQVVPHVHQLLQAENDGCNVMQNSVREMTSVWGMGICLGRV
jgi:hypothetical protein